jgi:membrane-bound serine protease (ClpP class)
MRRTDRDPWPSSTRVRGERRRRITLAVSFVIVALVVLAASPADAFVGRTPTVVQEGDTAEDAQVFDVIQVSGFIDEINADFIERSLEEAADLGSGGVILQVNSSAAVIDDHRLIEVARAIRESPVPVYAWVGPSGGKAKGGAAQLVAVAEEIGIAFGAAYGDLGELVVGDLLTDERREQLAGLEDTVIDEEEARERGLIAYESPTLARFAVGPAEGEGLPGFEVVLDETSGEDATLEIASPVRLRKLSLFKGWMHSVASPAMAYLLFLIGAGLLIFEFYTAGIGIAGVVGAGCFILGCYGLDVLPTRPWALALLVVAMLGYAVDVQTGVARAWSVIATVCLVIGSLFLYDGFSISWITLLVGIVGVAVSMISGMPAMVRTRFGTPTIGREWMVGMMGEAAADIRKEGVVLIDGAPWRARVNRTTPIAAGDPVRVVAIEGLYLEIEPEEGGARDYREMRGGRDREPAAETSAPD